MKARDIIKELMDEKNVSIAEMARSMEISNQNVWNTLSGSYSKSIQVDKLVKFLDRLNYKLVIVPYNSKISGYVVDEKE